MNMQEGNNYSLCAVATVLTWVAVGVLIAAMWVATALGYHHLGDALGYSGCTLSAVAAVLHIRRFMSRMMRLVRALHTPREVSEAEARGLQPVR